MLDLSGGAPEPMLIRISDVKVFGVN